MKDLRKAAQQALEALVAAYQGKDKTGQVTDAITALRAALAEPEQEPVAWAEEIIEDLHALYDTEMIRENDSGDALIRLDDAIACVEDAKQHYTAPTPRKPQTTHWEGCEAVHPECKEKA